MGTSVGGGDVQITARTSSSTGGGERTARRTGSDGPGDASRSSVSSNRSTGSSSGGGDEAPGEEKLGWENCTGALGSSDPMVCESSDQILDSSKFTPDGVPRAAAPAAPPPPDPKVVARAAVARMTVPAPTAQVGPDPTRNEWNMLAVGFPVWLWSEGPSSLQQTMSEQGITIAMTAQLSHVTFSMGDGTTVDCTVTSRYDDRVTPGTPSPTCGHRYQRVSGPGGFAVSATTHWQVSWSALGQQGTVPMERTGASRTLVIGELASVRVR